MAGGAINKRDEDASEGRKTTNEAAERTQAAGWRRTESSSKGPCLVYKRARFPNGQQEGRAVMMHQGASVHAGSPCCESLVAGSMGAVVQSALHHAIGASKTIVRGSRPPGRPRGTASANGQTTGGVQCRGRAQMKPCESW